MGYSGACRWKKAMVWPMVSAGVVVAMRASATMWSGSLPMTQLNLVPPASMPP